VWRWTRSIFENYKGIRGRYGRSHDGATISQTNQRAWLTLRAGAVSDQRPARAAGRCSLHNRGPRAIVRHVKLASTATWPADVTARAGRSYCAGPKAQDFFERDQTIIDTGDSVRRAPPVIRFELLGQSAGAARAGRPDFLAAVRENVSQGRTRRLPPPINACGAPQPPVTAARAVRRAICACTNVANGAGPVKGRDAIRGVDGSPLLIVCVRWDC